MKRGRAPDPRRAKIHFSYTIAEAARLFGVHRNTVRGWLRQGLESIKLGRETIILGADLRAHLARRRTARRIKTPPGAICCLRCRAPRTPAEGLVELLRSVGPTANVRGICGDCGAFMHRRVNVERLADAGFPGLVSPEVDSHLVDSPNPSLNCHHLKDA